MLRHECDKLNEVSTVVWRIFNSTQIQRKEAQWAYINSRSLRKQSILFLNNSSVPQLINHIGKLFHASITLVWCKWMNEWMNYSNCKKKYFLASKQTWDLKSLSSWPLSPVNDLVKKSVCLMSSKPLKILKTSIKSPHSLLVSSVVIPSFLVFLHRLAPFLWPSNV